MPVTQPDGAIRAIASGTFVDAKFSSDGTKLYAVSGNQVSVIDVATGSVVAQYTVGTQLGAFDLSVDGHYLAIVEAHAGSSATLYRIDLTNGAVSSFATSLGQSQGSFYDVAFLADGTALVSQQLIGSGSNPLRVLDFGTGLFSIPGGFMSPASNLGTATLTTSADHSHVLLEPYSVQQTSYVYVSGTGIVAGAIGIADPYAGAALPSAGSGVQATSPSGDLHVQGVSLNVYDGSLNLLRTLASPNSPYLSDPDGLSFSPDGHSLYVANGNYVFVIDTSTWNVIGAYAPGNTVANARDANNGTVVGFGDIVQASADGHYLSVIAADGIKLIDLTLAQFAVTQGPDVVTGNGILVGLGGDDHLSATGLGAFMFGGAGDDTYIVTSSFDQVFEAANEGHDTVQSSVDFSLTGFSAGGNAEDLLLTGAANLNGYGNQLDNLITGNTGANLLSGFAGNDQLQGGDGNDTLDGGAGDDQLHGGNDNDSLDGGAGDDLLDGGAGTDLATYASATGAVTVDLSQTAPQNTVGAGSDTLLDIENLTGSSFDDHLTGNSAANRLDGGSGADLLAGGGGDDIYLVDSADTVVENPGGGTDLVIADFSYTLSGGVENLNLTGTAFLNGTGNDLANLINGNSGDNVLSGLAGSDVLNGSDGADTLIGGAGDDTLDGGSGTDLADYSDAAAGVTVNLGLTMQQAHSTGPGDAANIGTDTLYNIESLRGGAFDDTFQANFWSVSFFGGGGNDALTGGAQADLFVGGSGNDRIDGGDGIDTVDYSQESGGGDVVVNLFVMPIFDPIVIGSHQVRDSYGTIDTLTSIEHVITGGGNDTIVGSSATEVFEAGAGNDVLTSGGGGDTLIGGAGNDTYVVSAGDTVVELAFDGTDQILTALDTYSLINAPNVENLRGTSTTAGQSLGGNDLDNAITGSAGDDFLSGGNGNDVLDGGAGTDMADYFNSTVGITVSLATADPQDTGQGFDTLLNIEGVIGTDHDDHVSGSSGHDVLFGLDGEDVLSGGGGADVIEAGAGNDTVHGDAGDDVLIGADGSDSLDGGAGADILQPGNGIDTITGGTGADTFWSSAAGFNGDTITDFGGLDKIVIVDANIATFAFSLSGNTLTYTGGSMTLANFAGQIVASAAVDGGVELTIEPAGRNDFNGDGVSDVLLQNDNGTVRDWLGQAPNGNFVGNIDKVNILTGPEWHVIGSGDFNGDGYVDVLWQHDNGTVRDWLGQADGSFKGNIDKVNIVSDWHAVGVGDFNGDGMSDVLWQNANGTIRDWLGQGDGSFTGNIDRVNVLTGPEWHVIGTGDFNGDGYDDILWKHDNGTVRDWLGQADGSFVGNIDHVNILSSAEWHAIGTGDFNGDGTSDILWRNDDGTIREWLGQSDGSFIGNIEHVNFVPAAGTHVVDIGDYNDDGIDDLLWQSADGTVTQSLGQSDGSFADNSANVTIHTGTDWHVQAAFVHDLLL